MIIEKMTVKGTLGLSISFGKINYILGENNTGKTTFIKLLLYALGTNIENFIDEITKFNMCNQVELDIEMKNGLAFRVIRKLPFSETVIVVPMNASRELIEEEVEIMELDEYSDFLLQNEGFDKQEIVYGNNNKASMRYYFLLRAVIADQDTPAYKLLADLGGVSKSYINNQGLIKKAIIEAILGKDNNEVQKARFRLQSLLKERSTVNSKIDMLEEVNLNEHLELNKIKDPNKIKQKLLRIEEEKNKLAVENTKYLVSLEKVNIKTIDNEMIKLKEETLDVRSKIRNLSLERQDITNLSNTLQQEINKLKKMIVARQLITHIPVERCPVCLNNIDPHSHNHDDLSICSFCNSEVGVSDLEKLSKYKKMLEESFYEASKVRKEIFDQIKEYEIQMKNAENKLAKYRQNVLKKQKEIKNPVEDLIESIRIRLEVLTKEEQSLESYLKYLEHRDNLRSEKNDLDSEISESRDILDDLEKTMKYTDSEKLDEWISLFSEELNYIFGDTLNAFIDSEYSPVISETDVKNISSASLKVATRLSYLLSLFQIKDVVDINHLNYIMFDSPKDKDLDQDKYSRFLEQIEQSESGQVFLTGSITESHLYNSENIIMTLYKNEKLLKRQEEVH
ncbi:hypothetical protein P9H28_00760 [Paenibacillus barengoltzii]|uniref:hypothetical protein n=1 Tax=Paenibacillus barengoltzii TaxID=343517 RepID=UPI002DBD0038|nr:hypothetical protein [Paenibacillus barengoltzii]MEC2342632.1 hypothetical protein [Paenibacillus barengoltzii]